MPDAGPRFPGSGMLVGPHGPPLGGLTHPGPGMEDPDDLSGAGARGIA